MPISRFIAVPVFATLSLAVSLALLPIKAEPPHGAAIAKVSAANPA